MTITDWAFFALINTIVLLFLDHDPEKSGIIQAFIFGVAGLVIGYILLFLGAKGMTQEFALTLSLIIILEAFLFMTLLSTRLIKIV